MSKADTTMSEARKERIKAEIREIYDEGCVERIFFTSSGRPIAHVSDMTHGFELENRGLSVGFISNSGHEGCYKIAIDGF